jgi:hypothetical protein
MKISKTHLINKLILFALFMLPLILHAQPTFDDGVADDVPIDGGLSLLLAAGIGYGVKKVRERKKNRSINNEIM